MPINCATQELVPYTSQSSLSWNAQRVKHFTRRCGLGVNQPTLDTLLNQPCESVFQQYIDQAPLKPNFPEPFWAFWTVQDYSDIASDVTVQALELATYWLRQIQKGDLKSKMTLFWHNHFVTQFDVYKCPSYLYQYYNLLETHALGNFRDFVREIGLTPAMLIYLNGVQNTKFEPNENYARELLELFTLGLDNGYTQQDIAEIARALTGYNRLEVGCGPITFRPNTQDTGTKTIFGQTGNWGYDDVIDLLFAERPKLIATHICAKLYAYFVNPKLDETIIDQLADLMVNVDFELLPVIKTLLTSEHFFDEANFETVIPGHMEVFFIHANETDQTLSNELVLSIAGTAGEIGQRILNPVDVAGWQGNREWINTNSILRRWQGLANLTTLKFYDDAETFRTFAINLVGDSNDPEFISKQIIQYFIPKGLQFNEDYDKALMRFKGDVPQNYFEDGSWNLYWESAPAQVGLLIIYITALPEYQLK